MAKLYSTRIKIIKTFNDLAKNLNDKHIYYIHNNRICAESSQDDRYNGGFYIDMDLSPLYLDPNAYYRINGAKLYTFIKDKKPKIVEINNDKITLVSPYNDTFQIKPCKPRSRKLYEFRMKLEDYKDFNGNGIDIYDVGIEALSRTVPILIEVPDKFGDTHKIRFVKKMIKVGYSEKNLNSLSLYLKKVTEQLYILKIVAVKQGVPITHLYYTVPF